MRILLRCKMRNNIVRHIRGWNFHRMRTCQCQGFHSLHHPTNFVITQPAESLCQTGMATIALDLWYFLLFKVTNKATVAAGKPPGSGTQGESGARRGKNSWSRSLHRYRAARAKSAAARAPPPPPLFFGFIIISVLIDSKRINLSPARARKDKDTF